LNKFLFVLIVILSEIFLIAEPSYSQLNLEWVRTWNNTPNQDNYITDMKQDSLGNTYLLVFYNGYNTIKYNKNGELIWARYYRSPYNIINSPIGLAVDKNGNAYVTGDDASSWFTVKYDSSGVLRWVKSYSILGVYSSANAITLDDASNVYVVGSSVGTGVYRDICVVKYNTNGNVIYEYTYDSGIEGNDEANSIAIDGNQNAYITGTIGKAGIDDVCTFKLTSNGQLAWMKYYTERLGGFQDTGTIDYGQKIVLDSENNSYVMVKSEKRFNNGSSAKCLKYSESGNLEWVYTYYDTLKNSIPRDLILDNDYNPLLILDNDYNPLFSLRVILTDFNVSRICKINKITGELTWGRNFYNQINKGYLPIKLIIDEYNNIFLIGTETFYLISNSQYGLFFLKYNSSGNLIWDKYYYDLDSNFSGNNLIKNRNGIFISGEGYIESLSSFKSYLLKYNDVTNIENINYRVSNNFVLYGNFPNPFNSSTKIKYSLTRPANIKLKVYDVLGKEIYRLEKKEQQTGVNYILLDLKLNSGVFLYSVYVDNELKYTRKMVVIK